jgi:hypothetical protein
VDRPVALAGASICVGSHGYANADARDPMPEAMEKAKSEDRKLE